VAVRHDQSRFGVTVDLHTLTGAFVLDAVSRTEQRAFERHLGACESCAREVVELRETATRLATAVATRPPDYLRSAVLADIGRVRQRGGVVRALRDPHRVAARLPAAAAAVLLVVATTLGVLLARENSILEESRASVAAVSGILRADDATTVRHEMPGGRVTLVVSRQQDRLLLVADRLAPAPAGRDYQAWTVDGRFHAAGLLVPDAGRADLAVRGISGAESLAVTVEPRGGSGRPTTEPIMTIALP
jgi:anti-sigma-K factor RskA